MSHGCNAAMAVPPALQIAGVSFLLLTLLRRGRATKAASAHPGSPGSPGSPCSPGSPGSPANEGEPEPWAQDCHIPHLGREYECELQDNEARRTAVVRPSVQAHNVAAGAPFEKVLGVKLLSTSVGDLARRSGAELGGAAVDFEADFT